MNKPLKHILSSIIASNYKTVRPFYKKKLLILYYHRVVSSAEVCNIKTTGMYVTTSQFSQHISFLKDNFSLVSEKEIIEANTKKTNLPDYPLWITLDDGYRDNYTNAFPILKKYQVPATIFITTGFIENHSIPMVDYIAKAIEKTTLKEIKFLLDNKEHRYSLSKDSDKQNLKKILWNIFNYRKINPQSGLKFLQKIFNFPISEFRDVFMSWENILQMEKEGISFGAHTVNHPILTSIDAHAIEYEIKESKKKLEEKLNTQILTFAYPNGKKKDYELSICKQILSDNKFEMAVNTVGGFNLLPIPSSNIFSVRRIGISSDDTMNSLRTKLMLSGFWQ